MNYITASVGKKVYTIPLEIKNIPDFNNAQFKGIKIMVEKGITYIVMYTSDGYFRVQNNTLSIGDTLDLNLLKSATKKDLIQNMSLTMQIQGTIVTYSNKETVTLIDTAVRAVESGQIVLENIVLIK